MPSKKKGLFDFPDADEMEDEAFPPLPPPYSPGQEGQEDGNPFGNDEEDGEMSKLADVPAAKRKGVKRPQPKLDSQRLTSDRGLPALRTLFENVPFKGKGHEVEDLRLLMQQMENWAHRLFPKLQFEDFVDRVEKLGNKKEVQTCLKRIRLDMPLTHDDFMGDEEPAPEPHVFGDPDPFSGTNFPEELQEHLHSTPAQSAPPAPSPAAHSPAAPSLTEEQHRRMELNRQRALERKLARQHQQHTDASESQTTESSKSAHKLTSAPPPPELNSCEAPEEEKEGDQLTSVSPAGGCKSSGTQEEEDEEDEEEKEEKDKEEKDEEEKDKEDEEEEKDKEDEEEEKDKDKEEQVEEEKRVGEKVKQMEEGEEDLDLNLSTSSRRSQVPSEPLTLPAGFDQSENEEETHGNHGNLTEDGEE